MINIISTFNNAAKQGIKDDLLKKIMKNSGIILFGNSTASALNLVSFTLMAGQLGPRSLAILVLAQTYAIIINDIFNIQTWESMIKFGSGADNDNEIKNVIKTNLLLDAVSAAVAFSFAFLLVQPVAHFLGWEDTFLNVIALYSLSILFNITTFTIGIPRLFDRFLSIAKVQVTIALLKLGCIFLVMNLSNTVIMYIYVYLTFDILANVSLIIYSMSLLKNKYGGRWWRGGFNLDRDQLRFIWWTNLRTIVRIPVRRFDMIIISAVMSMEMVGIFKVYKEIAGLINRFGEPVNQSIFPEFTKLIGKRELRKTASVTRKTILLLFGVSLVITVGLMLVSGFLVGRFFGEDYLPRLNALYLLLAVYGVSFITVPINSLFIAAGFARASFTILFFTNLLYLLLAFGLGNLFGIYGIIMAFAAQTVINKGFKIFLLKRSAHEWGSVVR